MTALQFYAAGCAIWSLLLLRVAYRAPVTALRTVTFHSAVLSVVVWPVMLILILMRRTNP